jgi:hypothetical protein
MSVLPKEKDDEDGFPSGVPKDSDYDDCKMMQEAQATPMTPSQPTPPLPKDNSNKGSKVQIVETAVDLLSHNKLHVDWPSEFQGAKKKMLPAAFRETTGHSCRAMCVEYAEPEPKQAFSSRMDVLLQAANTLKEETEPEPQPRPQPQVLYPEDPNNPNDPDPFYVWDEEPQAYNTKALFLLCIKLKAQPIQENTKCFPKLCRVLLNFLEWKKLQEIFWRTVKLLPILINFLKKNLTLMALHMICIWSLVIFLLRCQKEG